MKTKNLLIGLSFGTSLLLAANVMAAPAPINQHCDAGHPCKVHHHVKQPVHHVVKHAPVARHEEHQSQKMMSVQHHADNNGAMKSQPKKVIQKQNRQDDQPHS